jgi:hypothetical protein
MEQNLITATKSTVYKCAISFLLASSFCLGSAYAAVCPQSAGLKAEKTALQAGDKGDLLICTYSASDSTQPEITPASGSWNLGQRTDSLECAGDKCEVNISQNQISNHDDEYNKCMNNYLSEYRILKRISGPGAQVPVDLYQHWMVRCGGPT